MSNTKMMCRFCGAVFNLDDISKPMEPQGFLHFVYVEDQCPKCKRGFDDWYVPNSSWHEQWRDAVRFQRNIKGGLE